MTRFFPSLVLALTVLPGAVPAQGTQIALGQTSFDVSLPVEVSADSLSVDQSTGQAVFDGNVLVVQGDVRLSAGVVEIEYATGTDGSQNGVSRLRASGGVTLVTVSDAVEASEAVYDLSSSTVTLTGDVLLTQGQTAISGERLVMNLTSGTGRMDGQVRTIFTPNAGSRN